VESPINLIVAEDLPADKEEEEEEEEVGEKREERPVGGEGCGRRHLLRSAGVGVERIQPR
jgi:hypothetical protein